MMRFSLGIFILIISMTSSGVALAVSDEFTITQLIGNDSTPPTVPSPVTATPITSSQIDVTWGASTDDQNLTGYKLFRDASQIATTTLLTYSDTGLTASTTYTYTVQAYDWMMNVSTTSASAATTTLAAVVTTPAATSTDSTSGSTHAVRMTDISVVPAVTSVYIEWSTNIYTRFTVRWGEGDVYNDGSVQTDVYKRDHVTVLTGLKPGTTYEYELVAYNQLGREYVLTKSAFTTLSAPDVKAPSNVSDLTYSIENDSVLLSWNNTQENDFDKVRVVRNYNFYPTDYIDGLVVYQGKSESFYDVDAVLDNDVQYYTVFTYDIAGNISSGATLKVYKTQSEDTGFGNDEDSVIVDPVPVSDIQISISQIDVSQNDISIVPDNNVLQLSGSDATLFSVPKALLPRHVKTIIMTVGESESESYIVRLNKDRSAYQTVLSPLRKPGLTKVTFTVHDHKTDIIAVFGGYLDIVHSDQGVEGQDKTGLLISNSIYKIAATLFVLILALMLFVVYRRSEDK